MSLTQYQDVWHKSWMLSQLVVGALRLEEEGQQTSVSPFACIAWRLQDILLHAAGVYYILST